MTSQDDLKTFFVTLDVQFHSKEPGVLFPFKNHRAGRYIPAQNTNIERVDG